MFIYRAVHSGDPVPFLPFVRRNDMIAIQEAIQDSDLTVVRANYFLFIFVFHKPGLPMSPALRLLTSILCPEILYV